MGPHSANRPPTKCWRIRRDKARRRRDRASSIKRACDIAVRRIGKNHPAKEGTRAAVERIIKGRLSSRRGGAENFQRRAFAQRAEAGNRPEVLNVSGAMELPPGEFVESAAPGRRACTCQRGFLPGRTCRRRETKSSSRRQSRRPRSGHSSDGAQAQARAGPPAAPERWT